MNIIAVKQGDEVIPLPRADYVFAKEEHLMVLGHMDDIRKVVD